MFYLASCVDLMDANALNEPEPTTLARETLPASPLAGAPRLGVALGGGSARGYAHIGALAVLERYRLTPQVVVGTSFGAVVGALYALGKSPDEIAKEAVSTRRRDLIREALDLGLHRAALFEGKRLEAYFDRLLEGRHFADLEREFAVVATDVDTGERVMLREGSLATALRASSSLPGIFAPVEVAGRRLIDGGIGSPVPVATLTRYQLDLALGIGVGLRAQDSSTVRWLSSTLQRGWSAQLMRLLQESSSPHPLNVLGRALACTVRSWDRQTVSPGALQVHAQPPISWLHFHQAEVAIRAGEQALEAFIPSVLHALKGLHELHDGFTQQA